MFLIAFQVISAVPAGWALISDPSGSKLGLPKILLNQSPFENFMIPGLFLFFILGLVPLIILYGLITKKELEILKYNLLCASYFKNLGYKCKAMQITSIKSSNRNSYEDPTGFKNL